MIVSRTQRLLVMIQGLGPALISLLAWDLLIVFLYQVMGWKWVGLSNIPLATDGAVIGIIIGFRNASAYARWWEARTFWGAIVNRSRTLGRQILTTMSPAQSSSQSEVAAAQRELVLYQVA